MKFETSHHGDLHLRGLNLKYIDLGQERPSDILQFPIFHVDGPFLQAVPVPLLSGFSPCPRAPFVMPPSPRHNLGGTTLTPVSTIWLQQDVGGGAPFQGLCLGEGGITKGGDRTRPPGDRRPVPGR